MPGQISVSPAARITNTAEDGTHELAPDLAYVRLAIVNVIFCGNPLKGDWVLVDAGVKGTAGFIRKAAERRFGKAAKPRAIILTHGHFDHVGAITALQDHWNVPIYAHELEHPYLDGRSSYPPPDPTVGGGLMASLAGLYPRGPVDLKRWLEPLPADGSVPYMPGWAWLPTPGHSPGHVSLWRGRDRALIAGDAFITTRQESAYAVALQKPEIHGPPMYYTPNWVASKVSVERLSLLKPEMVVTGHGPAMEGDEMRAALQKLADEFDTVAVPRRGRYVHHPA